MSAAPHLAAFAFLWAVGELFHQASNTKFGHSPLEIAITLLAAWVIARPWAVRRVLAFLAVQAVLVADQIPFVPNHLLLVGLVDVTILAAAMGLYVREGRLDGDRLVAAMGRPIRAMLVLVYAWAAIHKFNHSYFDPAASCGSMLTQHLVSDLGLPPLPAAALPWTIYFSLAIELAIPATLLFRQTRLVGLAIGLLFHFGLGLVTYDRYYNFSSLLLALYFLFTPWGTPDRVAAIWRRLPGTRWLAQPAVLTGLRGAVLAGAITVTILPAFSEEETWRAAVAFAARSAWIIYGGLTGLLFAAAMIRRADGLRTHPTVPGVPAMRWLMVMPAVALLNGATPYLGLKTEISFAMFSNLRTEDHRTNHFFLPVGYRLAGYQDDLVSVESTSLDEAERIYLAEDGYRMTFFELRRVAARYPNMAVTYSRAGETYTVARAGDDPELGRPFSWWRSKVLRFRPVQTGDQVQCLH